MKASLSFARPSDVSLDETRPGGVLRAATFPFDADLAEVLESHHHTIADCDTPGVRDLSLGDAGFDLIDLSRLARLQSLLERVRRAGRLTRHDCAEIRRRLWGRSFRLSDGKKLRILFVASEGIILRKAGPNGLRIDPAEKMTERDGHDAAIAVHGDQDVRGTPVRQLLRGLGPRLFRHESPDGANRRSPLFLINVWIPLQQTTRPLALMDVRTLDRQRHQLRYALPTESFLARREDRRLNDIWAYLHDDSQRWYFTSRMDSRRAYVFNTLGTPHGSFISAGEARAEDLYLRLRSAREAIGLRDSEALERCASVESTTLHPDTTAVLRDAIHTMEELLDQARRDVDGLFGARGNGWSDRAAHAMDRVVRKSIEMRAVALVTG